MSPDFYKLFHDEVYAGSHQVFLSFLKHFDRDAEEFVNRLTLAAKVWLSFERAKGEREELAWASAFFLNSINSTATSVRLFLTGYIVPSGNLVRHALESLAMGIMLPVPETGCYEDFRAERAIEHKAIERLRRNADHLDANREAIQNLLEVAGWYDQYSHPSRLSLGMATISVGSDGLPQFSVGAEYSSDKIEQYKKEMLGRMSLAELIGNAIAGSHATLKR